MAKTVEATFYIVLEGKRPPYGIKQANGLIAVDNARAVTLRSSRPNALSKDQVALPIKIQVPAGIFDPISPEVLIVVPDDYAPAAVVKAEVILDPL